MLEPRAAQTLPPDWFVNVQTSQGLLLGKGSNANQDKAIKHALADIAGQLNISIDASTSSQQQVVTSRGRESDYARSDSQVVATVGRIGFRGYAIEQSLYLKGQYYVLVSVEKATLLRSQKSELQIVDNDIELRYQSMKKAPLIQAIKTSQHLTDRVSVGRSVARVVAVLDQDFDIVGRQQRYTQLLLDVQQLKSKLSIYISAQKSAAIQSALLDKINSEQIVVVKNQDSFLSNTHIVDIVTSIDNKQMWDSYTTTLYVQLVLKEQGGNIVANNHLEVSGSSLKDYTRSERKAVQAFINKIETMSVLEVFGIYN